MIIQNAIQIVEDFPEEKFLVSTHVHDFREHVFKDGTTIFVDGGKDYIRRGGSALDNNPSEGYATKWVDWSLDDRIPFDTIKDRLLWGTLGKSGKEPLKFVRLVTCDTEHLESILKYSFSPGKEISGLYRQVIFSILGDRKI